MPSSFATPALMRQDRGTVRMKAGRREQGRASELTPGAALGDIPGPYPESLVLRTELHGVTI